MRRAQREELRQALPASAGDRLLLGLGAVALLAVLPALWVWLLYGIAPSPSLVYAGAALIGGLALGTGGAMIRILGERE